MERRNPLSPASGTLRFNAIRKRLPNITQRMLTTQLRELERDGFVLRTVYPEVPPKVEYSLTPRGRTLEPVILASRDGAMSTQRSDMILKFAPI